MSNRDYNEVVADGGVTVGDCLQKDNDDLRAMCQTAWMSRVAMKLELQKLNKAVDRRNKTIARLKSELEGRSNRKAGFLRGALAIADEALCRLPDEVDVLDDAADLITIEIDVPRSESTSMRVQGALIADQINEKCQVEEVDEVEDCGRCDQSGGCIFCGDAHLARPVREEP